MLVFLQMVMVNVPLMEPNLSFFVFLAAMVSGGYPVGECAPGMGAGMGAGIPYSAAVGREHGMGAFTGMGDGFSSESSGCIHTMGTRAAANTGVRAGGVGYGVGHGVGVANGAGFSSKSGGYSSTVTTKQVVTSGGGRHSSGISADGSCAGGHLGGMHQAVGGAGGIVSTSGSGGYSSAACGIGGSGVGMHSTSAGGAYPAGTGAGILGAVYGSRGDCSTGVRSVHVTSVTSSSRKCAY